METKKLPVVELGGLYLDGQAVKQSGVMYKEQQVSIGNTPKEGAMQFLVRNNILVATKVWLMNISWNKLNRLGLIFGTVVDIDGKSYFCRSLTGGASQCEPNEWDNLLDTVGDDTEQVDCLTAFSWCQEKAVNARTNWNNRVVRGLHRTRGRNSLSVNFANKNVGFRPVLEPLGPEAEFTDKLISANVRIFLEKGEPISGKVVEFSDYDLVLKVGQQAVGPAWTGTFSAGHGLTVVFDRSKLRYIEKQ